MDQATFIQQLINAISLGSMYALIAIGYTMVYGVLRLINFAHGDIMMIGAFGVYVGLNLLGFNFTIAFIFSILISIITGLLTDKVAYKPLRDAPKISLLITAIGVSFFLENIVNVIFGGTPKSFDTPNFFTQHFTVDTFIISYSAIIVPIVTFILLLIVLFILYRTKQGMAIRALAFDINTVNLMGISSNTIIAYVFAIGSFLAGIGGVFWAINYPILTPYMGVLIGLKAFASAVLGGIGSVSGAMMGGFILGFAEVMFVSFYPEYGGYKDAIAFIFLILVLLFRPTGIMGIDFEKNRF